MANRLIVKNSVVAGKKPATAATNKPGELWVNSTDRVIGTFDTAGAPVEVGVTAAKFTAGSVPFADTGGPLTEDNAALFWDKTNKRLGVGTTTPAQAIHVKRATAGVSIEVEDTSGYTSYGMYGGAASFGTDTSFKFYVRGATSVASITATGQLLVGTETAPTVAGALLAVNSDAQINLMTVGLGGGRKYSNVALGNAALASNTTGTSNLAIGSNALTKNIGGANCCAFGLNALSKNVSGNYNVGIGAQSLEANVSGSQNVGIGSSSLILSTGSNNVGIGHAAGRNIATGSGNVVIGGAGGEAAMNETIILSTGTGVERARLSSKGFKAQSFATAPAVTAADDGTIYFDTATKKLRVCASGAWVDLH